MYYTEHNQKTKNVGDLGREAMNVYVHATTWNVISLYQVAGKGVSQIVPSTYMI